VDRSAPSQALGSCLREICASSVRALQPFPVSWKCFKCSSPISTSLTDGGAFRAIEVSRYGQYGCALITCPPQVAVHQTHGKPARAGDVVTMHAPFPATKTRCWRSAAISREHRTILPSQMMHSSYWRYRRKGTLVQSAT
jgi:hypothetical protein